MGRTIMKVWAIALIVITLEMWWMGDLEISSFSGSGRKCVTCRVLRMPPDKYTFTYGYTVSVFYGEFGPAIRAHVYGCSTISIGNDEPYINTIW